MPVILERRRRHRDWHAPTGPQRRAALRTLGLGMITGAADVDPSAIGTYAKSGAQFGPAILWTAPLLLPLMITAVYLASKLGQVAGQGLAAVVKAHFPRPILALVVGGVVLGNTIEAGADLGGMAAALRLLLPGPLPMLVALLAAGILALQWFGSYTWIRSVFRWLALALLAYIISALLAHPSARAVLEGTLLPHLRFNRDSIAMLVAIIGTSLSPYLYVWQAGQEVEEDVSMGRRRLSDRKGTTFPALRATAWDVVAGMTFSSLVMYFILLSTAATLYQAGGGQVATAAEAARALVPVAGPAASALFALGVIGVGVLAVPVMTVGAAYVVCDAGGWKSGLGAKPREAKAFYAVIAAVTAVAVGVNFLGIAPLRALVGAGIVQGLLAPGLLVLLMLMTNNPSIMGAWTNTRKLNLLGWATTAVVAAAAALLLASAF